MKLIDTFSPFRLVAPLCVAAILTGCASTDSQNDDFPFDEEPVTSAADDASSATTSAIGDASTSTQTYDEAATLENVFYFNYDQFTLTAEARMALDAQAAYLRSTTQPIRLEGHADERGSREYNLALGEKRANAVADYLAIQGVSRARIETVSYGEERPAVYGSTESSYARNRRVELK